MLRIETNSLKKSKQANETKALAPYGGYKALGFLLSDVYCVTYMSLYTDSRKLTQLREHVVPYLRP